MISNTKSLFRPFEDWELITAIFTYPMKWVSVPNDEKEYAGTRLLGVGDC